jgi:hypothetical protein
MADDSKSRWSRWRKIKRNVNEHLDFVNQAVEVNEGPLLPGASHTDGRKHPRLEAPSSSSPIADGSGSHRPTDLQINNTQSDETFAVVNLCVQQGDQLAVASYSLGDQEEQALSDNEEFCPIGNDRPTFDDEVENEQFENDDDFDDYYSYSDNSSGSDLSDIEDEVVDDSVLTDDLAAWAADSQIPHNKIRGLLSVLLPFHPNLPKDPRTLLETTTSYEIQNIAGGSYYHFGLVQGIKTSSSELLGIENGGTVHIQINIDGLPLYKSSKTQFWPILGRISMPFTADPFIIGLFCGENKPDNVDLFMADLLTLILRISVSRSQ